MGVPLNLQDIQSGFLTASALTANNTLIEQAMNKALDRTGNTDNAMEVNLDMGLNRIINGAAGINQNDFATLSQLDSRIEAASSQITSTSTRETFTATAGQTDFSFLGIEYVQGTNALLVFVNGVYQVQGTEYTEDSSTSISFNSPLQDGDIVVVMGAKFNAEALVDEAENFANQASGFADDASGFADDAEQYALDAQSALGSRFEINDQTTNYTLVIDDKGDYVRIDNANDSTVTVPAESSVNFPIGTIVVVRQVGAGTVTLVADTGVTLNAANNELNTAGVNYSVGIVKVDADEWDVVKSYAGTQSADIDSIESDITALDGRVTTNESDITAVEGRVTTAESDIDTLESDVSTLQANFGSFLDTSDFPASITQSTNSDGWQELPSGLIFQWGEADATGQTWSSNRNFPKTFPNAAIAIYASTREPQFFASDDATPAARITSNSTYQLSTTHGSNMRVYWFAIGV